MNKFYAGSAAVLMLALSGCDEGPKDNAVSETAKSVVSNFPAASGVPELKVVQWGPSQTTVGVVVNKQPSGESAVWFSMSGGINPGTNLELWFGETKLTDVVFNAEGGSAILPSTLLNKAGDYPIYLIHEPSKKRFDIGVFKILP